MTEKWNVLSCIYSSFSFCNTLSHDLVECFFSQVYLVENIQDGLDSALKVSQTHDRFLNAHAGDFFRFFSFSTYVFWTSF
jgi:hypothetical protein